MYNDTIMTLSKNRIKSHREARGWSQAELAERSGISRSGISAIESERLSPSVEAALQLARILECTVEDLFGIPPASAAIRWAGEPPALPCRYWLAEVGGRTLAFSLETPTAQMRLADGVAREALLRPPGSDLAERTLVLATCDPAAPFLAELFERHSPFRLLILSRPSGGALQMLEQGLVHVAGIHLSRVAEKRSNAAILSERKLAENWSLLRASQWEEGLAVAQDSAIRSLRQAAKQSLRWIGRLPGAGARRCQDELRGDARPPTRTARDHRAVAEAIVNDWADAGICLRLTSDEAHLRFFSICEDQYDLCFPERYRADPRIAALVKTIRSTEYRELIGQLPGYRAADAGELETVAAAV